MKKIMMLLAVAAFAMTGCESQQAKADRKAKQLAQLTCESSREGRSTEELQVIGDACFRKGSFKKSTHQSW